MRTRLIATVAMCALALPAVALDGPEDPVRAIYGDLGVPDTAAEADRWLARDVAAAYKVALRADEPKPSTDFDWRYGSQDYDITEVSVGPTPWADDVAAAVLDLPERQRQVVVLRYVLDLDLATIAGIVGISVGGVKNALHHGRSTLERRLAAADHLDPEATT